MARRASGSERPPRRAGGTLISTHIIYGVPESIQRARTELERSQGPRAADQSMADDAPAAEAPAAAAEAPAASKTPADFLKNIKGKPVVVKLNSGVDYKGERRSAAVAAGGAARLAPASRIG